MTALGFLLIVFSLWIGAKFGGPSPQHKNAWDYVGGALFNIGAALILLGLVLWLWVEML